MLWDPPASVNNSVTSIPLFFLSDVNNLPPQKCTMKWNTFEKSAYQYVQRCSKNVAFNNVRICINVYFYAARLLTDFHKPLISIFRKFC